MRQEKLHLKHRAAVQLFKSKVKNQKQKVGIDEISALINK
jgi:hypothetical protein